MNRELVIGLDIGTTSVKAVMFNTKGKFVAVAEELLTTFYPKPGWAEQDPAQVESLSKKALHDCIKKANVTPDELLAVGLSCAMHSLICVDENDQPLSNMLIWSDRRSASQAEAVRNSDQKDIYLKTGTPIHPMTPFLKLRWMKENHYEPYFKATYFMTMKDYLLKKWFGQSFIDYGMASSTGMLNLKNLDWDEDALQLAGVCKNQFSKIVPPTKILTGINSTIAMDIGIRRELPFIVGSSDGPLANLGSGAILPGELNISVGTSGAIRQFTKNFPINEKQDTFTYAFTTTTSIIGGATNNGGIALQWAKELFNFQGSFEEFVKGTDNIKPGSEGLFFHPFVNGERAPLWNSQARGNLFGLRIGHNKEHVVRAILEGISFNIYQIGQSLEKLIGKPEKITINGGLSKSPQWVQIMADIFGQEVFISETHHNAAWGAAWTALVAIGRVPSFAAIKGSLPKETVIKPNQENYHSYQKIYQKYSNLLKVLQEHF